MRKKWKIEGAGKKGKPENCFKYGFKGLVCFKLLKYFLYPCSTRYPIEQTLT